MTGASFGLSLCGAIATVNVHIHGGCGPFRAPGASLVANDSGAVFVLSVVSLGLRPKALNFTSARIESNGCGCAAAGVEMTGDEAAQFGGDDGPILFGDGSAAGQAG